MQYAFDLVIALSLWLTPWVAQGQAAPQRFSIVALRQFAEVPLRPEDEGHAGTHLTVRENETIERFLKQSFSVDPGGLGVSHQYPKDHKLPGYG